MTRKQLESEVAALRAEVAYLRSRLQALEARPVYVPVQPAPIGPGWPVRSPNTSGVPLADPPYRVTVTTAGIYPTLTGAGC